MADITAALDNLLFELDSLDLADKVDALNQIRSELHAASPFEAHPVDLVLWEPVEAVEANDYNPNSVATPEMELLALSIEHDGYTQPIVVNPEEDHFVVVDGFHRNRVGQENEDIKKTLHGYLPVVKIRDSQTGKADRIASTIRHNRARGKHQVSLMSDIVLDLKRRNWSDKKIGKELGMDQDEVLRLSQISGLADAFSHEEFTAAWEPE